VRSTEELCSRAGGLLGVREPLTVSWYEITDRARVWLRGPDRQRYTATVYFAYEGTPDPEPSWRLARWLSRHSSLPVEAPLHTGEIGGRPFAVFPDVTAEPFSPNKRSHRLALVGILRQFWESASKWPDAAELPEWRLADVAEGRAPDDSSLPRVVTHTSLRNGTLGFRADAPCAITCLDLCVVTTRAQAIGEAAAALCFGSVGPHAVPDTEGVAEMLLEGSRGFGRSEKLAARTAVDLRLHRIAAGAQAEDGPPVYAALIEDLPPLPWPF